MKPSRPLWSRNRYDRLRAKFDAMPSTTLMAIFVFTVASHVVTVTEQAVITSVVRLAQVDVPPLVRSWDATPDPDEEPQPPLLLGCTYGLSGGENDDENGADQHVVRPKKPGNATATQLADRGRRLSPDPELAMDAAIEEVQRARGLVVKWYYRPNPLPPALNDAKAIIDDSVQVYQWMAGGGPGTSGPLGPLIGHAVDVSFETPRIDNTLLHRVIRVDRPTSELTGEYRCQVEDWRAERRSIWHPMVVYTPERVFTIMVSDNDDDEHSTENESDVKLLSSSTLPTPTTASSISSSSSTSSISSSAKSSDWNDSTSEIKIVCYAAGVHPEPSMSIWVNGVEQTRVKTVVRYDDGDDDETNDDDHADNSTTTAKPKTLLRGRYRKNEALVYNLYSVRADAVVSLIDVEEYHLQANGTEDDRDTVEVECRLRVPGDGAGQGFWKADRPANRFYSARKSYTYVYRSDLSTTTPWAGKSSSDSDVSTTDCDNCVEDDNAAAQESPNNGAASVVSGPFASLFVQYAFVAATAAAAAVIRQ